MKQGVLVDPNRFQEVLTSKYGRCRVYKILDVSQESKKWAADPQNRVCDAPGSWYCSGQYPPALQKVLEEKKDFEQLEDFNKDKGDSEYQALYHENLKKKNQGEPISAKEAGNGEQEEPWAPVRDVSQDEID